MKILMLARYYYPHVGGVEKHVKNIGEKFTNRGHKVTIVTALHDKKLKGEEKLGNILVFRLPLINKRFVGLLGMWTKIFELRRLVKDSDIVHIHDVFIWYLPLRFLYPSKPVYTTFHGWEEKYPIPKINILIKKISVNLSKGSISVGKYIGKYYKIKTDIVTYGAVKSNIKRVKKDDKLIVYVGRLNKISGLNTYLKALKKLKGYEIIFCGDGELREECEKIGKVLGFVDPNPHLAKAQFCLTSGYLTIIEALAHKCLVLKAYENDFLKDVFSLTPFNKYIILTNSEKRIVKTISDFGNRESYYNKKIEAGYNWARKQTWERMADNYLRLWGVK